MRTISTVLLAFGVLCFTAIAVAQPRPCRKGFKGVYVTWSKDATKSGEGVFNASAGRASVVPNFSWSVTGPTRDVRIGQAEPFGGGNSMKGFYGQADDANNLNVRIRGNDLSRGSPIQNVATVQIDFNSGTPASGWGFAVIDIDVDQVRVSAVDTKGDPVPHSRVARWLQQRFDANPSVDGVNIPSFDVSEAAVIGSESRSTQLRSTVEGNLDDTEAASAWFQPNVSLASLTFEYQSLQEEATPSFHVLIAACESNVLTPTPTPAPAGDSDGDSISDSSEGSGDPDNDQVPNYLDKDSDGDTIPDSIEGDDDQDDDGVPNYLDNDSDGDDVPDEVEREPDSESLVPSGEDDDRDGVDDALEDRTDNVVSDTDGDTVPDYEEEDSDNDGKDDGEEAYDLDGNGERDIFPSGNDADEDGLDDSFEFVDGPEDLNPEFSSSTDENAPCEVLRLRPVKQQIRTRLTALTARTPRFAERASICGGSLAALVNSSAAARRTFERALDGNFHDREFLCGADTCSARDQRTAKARLSGLARELGRYAKRAKSEAGRVCGEPPSKGEAETRPRTDAYIAQLQREIAKLPNRMTRCG